MFCVRCVSPRRKAIGWDQIRRTVGWTELLVIQRSLSARQSQTPFTRSCTDRAGTKFDDACTAGSFFIGSGELVVSLRAAVGNSREPHTRIAAMPVRGAPSFAAKELWQSSLCVDGKLAHAREPQSEAQSGATSIARRVKIATARPHKLAFRSIFIVDTPRYAGGFVESTRPRRAVSRRH